MYEKPGMIVFPLALTPTFGASLDPCKTFRSTPLPLSAASRAPASINRVKPVEISSGLGANEEGSSTPLATT